MCCYPDAAAAADNCYDTFNAAGRFNGHCGLNGTSGGYLRCDAEYVVLFLYLITIFCLRDNRSAAKIKSTVAVLSCWSRTLHGS